MLADLSVSISELKKNPSALLSQASGSAIAVLNHNKPAAYLIPAETYEALMDMIDDYELAQLVEERRGDKDQAMRLRFCALLINTRKFLVTKVRCKLDEN